MPISFLVLRGSMVASLTLPRAWCTCTEYVAEASYSAPKVIEWRSPCGRAVLPAASVGEASGSAPKIGDCSAGAPLVDVVFVHGIRGGPFASWRAGKDAPRGAASESLTHRSCWPSEWLSRDVPGTRLLSMEYAAPASGWEVWHLSSHHLASA